jgi:hypothetical protein
MIIINTEKISHVTDPLNAEKLQREREREREMGIEMLHFREMIQNNFPALKVFTQYMFVFLLNNMWKFSFASHWKHITPLCKVDSLMLYIVRTKQNTRMHFVGRMQRFGTLNQTL